MRLCKLKQFRSLVYAIDSEPSMATLRTHIDKKLIPGGQRDGVGRYYVDLDEYSRATNMYATLADKQRRLSESPDLVGLI